MASLYQRGSRFYAQFHDADRSPSQKQISLKTSNERTANALLYKWERLYERYQKGLKDGADPWHDDMHTAVQPDRAEAVAVADAVEQFVDVKEANTSAATARTYKGILGRFARFVGTAEKLGSLTASDYRAFIHSGDVADATKKKRFVHLRAFLKWAEREGLLDRQPLDKLTAPTVTKKLPVAATEEEVSKIVMAMRTAYKAGRKKNQMQAGQLIWKTWPIRFSFRTGLRVSEIAALRWKDVDLDEAPHIEEHTPDPTVRLREQKSREEQILPISEKAADLLREIRPAGNDPVEQAKKQTFKNGDPKEGPRQHPDPIDDPEAFFRGLRTSGAEAGEQFVFQSPSFEGTERNQKSFANNLSRTFRQYRKKLGLREGLHFHSLRAGFITELCRAGLNAFQIRRLSRHKDPETVMRYLEMTDSGDREALREAFGEPRR
jgi:integrase